MNVTKTTAQVHIRSRYMGVKKRSTKSILKQLEKHKRKVKRG
tara:strand:- start:22 stop:147 length:126 start_codon:yes stop_codon:yes gene_type:complete